MTEQLTRPPERQRADPIRPGMKHSVKKPPRRVFTRGDVIESNVARATPGGGTRRVMVMKAEKNGRRESMAVGATVAPPARFDFPATLRGSTQHFNVYYDPSLGANGQAIADAVIANCEADYTTLSGYFGGIQPASFNIIIAALDPSGQGQGGAYHYGCSATDLYCDVKTVPTLDTDFTNFLVIAEEVEVFEALQGQGWDCGAGNGEGLSRVLATALYPAELDGYTTAAVWLDTPGRPDFVTVNEATDGDPVANGCAVLFLNWLHSQLGYGWDQISQAAAPTLAQTYTNLTGATDGLQKFKALLQAHFPEGQPSGVTTDNPFPLSDAGPFTLIAGDWNLDANGFTGVLSIQSIDSQGNLTGTIYGDPINGFWDETAQKITFQRIININDPSTNQIYTGYLFDNSRDQPTDLTYTLTGSFEAFAGTGATAQRTLYGWFAQLTVTGLKRK